MNFHNIDFEQRLKLVAKHQALMEKNQAAIDTHEFVKAKTKLIQKHANTVKELFDTCTHDRVITTSRYYDGSYLDKASTCYTDKCVLCGKIVGERRETHNWYG